MCVPIIKPPNAIDQNWTNNYDKSLNCPIDKNILNLSLFQTSVLSGLVCLLDQFTLWNSVPSGQVCILYQCAFWISLHSGPVCILDQCSSGPVSFCLHSGTVCILVQCTFETSVHSEPVFILNQFAIYISEYYGPVCIMK